MTISIKPTASGSTIEQDGSTILTVDGSGNITIANDLSVTGSSPLPTGPAFAVQGASAQSISSGTWTKVTYSSEIFDTDSCYDNSTNYRFQPTVAGYYQVNGHTGVAGVTTELVCAIFKNGVNHKWGDYQTRASTVIDMDSGVNALVYLNGSTDYIELYVYASGSSLSVYGSNTFSGRSYFDACLVRAA